MAITEMTDACRASCEKFEQDSRAAAAVPYLMAGERVAFLEFFSGTGLLATSPQGRDLYGRAFGEARQILRCAEDGSPWDLSTSEGMEACLSEIAYLDPVVVHFAFPLPFFSRRRRGAKLGL